MKKRRQHNLKNKVFSINDLKTEEGTLCTFSYLSDKDLLGKLGKSLSAR